MDAYIAEHHVLVNPLVDEGSRRSAAAPAPSNRCQVPTRAPAAGPDAPRPNAGSRMTHDDRLPPRPLDALDALKSESIHIFREVAGEFDRPVILFSGGKDSTLLVHLAAKAFAPAPVPFPLLHVDTGHNYPEVIDFRDRLVERLRAAPGGRARPGLDRRRPARRAPRRHPQPVADRAAARLDRRAPVRRGVRRRPA